MKKSIWKRFVEFFYVPDRSCPICNLTNTEHKVEHVPDGPQRDGSVTSSFTLKCDDDGNVWRVDFNRRCRRCAHVWYAPTGLDFWDEPRLKGPQLVSTPGEIKRFDERVRKRGGVTLPELSKINTEERIKAGFLYDTREGRWVRNSKPPR